MPPSSVERRHYIDVSIFEERRPMSSICLDIRHTCLVDSPPSAKFSTKALEITLLVFHTGAFVFKTDPNSGKFATNVCINKIENMFLLLTYLLPSQILSVNERMFTKF